MLRRRERVVGTGIKAPGDRPEGEHAPSRSARVILTRAVEIWCDICCFTSLSRVRAGCNVCKFCLGFDVLLFVQGISMATDGEAEQKRERLEITGVYSSV